jgi:hypothetical protein
LHRLRSAALAAGLALLAAVPAAPAAAQDAIAPGDSATVATIERLFVVADLRDLYEQSMAQSLEAQLRAAPMLEPYADLLRDFMERYASWEVMKPDLVRLYREVFTEDDIRQMIAFYETDFGQRMMAKMPQVMARTSELSARRVQEHFPELLAELEERMAADGVVLPHPE